MEMIQKVFRKTRMFGELVMFSHTLFSLPFAVISMVWAAGGIPSAHVMLWSLIALVGARNGANAFNRLVDRRFDEANPRTAHRHMPRKLLREREVTLFVAVNFAIFILAAGMLNPLCLWLAPVAIVLICSYSYTKRFTWLCHLYLGFTIASAPIGAWFAVTGQFAVTPFILGTIVMLWIAGFDIIYATQDIEFDRKTGLWSVPSLFGYEDSLFIARSLHMIMVVLLLALFFIQGLGWIYLGGIGAAAVLLAIEHNIIKPSNRQRMNVASYNLNQVISMVILFCTMADFFLR
ncbi:UbiA-like polyprenyltransferase [Paenibacillus apiarius]|uniref:4-hydroxybenzoate polyprenyltransferase n=1 Tax=Paenibacillus apiarius TaxID=46240 RepID=A0ABT4DNF0_9BACL|nr:UbiA-like polyprenyltransferase [Paenibacillus apiarius]MCY9515477.1 putative 4-hydroxybenzoate polyprenyltransferase [Paenibacillus apiarius]MCY9518886.1 putative 4-hydroxybenzoate polyprenyltransferase [Paenibacillus apiarius]MCY9552068.1 putative 4-hydroxybenzoate polyprenyltransferase [Paenibacillus apiarius]MCY9557256.1 putative 4-hydroxybenzoate polyprenyltransferase [Paenibacillus apiarius]MCY9682565.1 putative 4-hydroxybenzoate polyprenyltransferase [Paenibacillus apiarius]